MSHKFFLMLITSIYENIRHFMNIHQASFLFVQVFCPQIIISFCCNNAYTGGSWLQNLTEHADVILEPYIAAMSTIIILVDLLKDF